MFYLHRNRGKLLEVGLFFLHTKCSKQFQQIFLKVPILKGLSCRFLHSTICFRCIILSNTTVQEFHTAPEKEQTSTRTYNPVVDLLATIILFVLRWTRLKSFVLNLSDMDLMR